MFSYVVVSVLMMIFGIYIMDPKNYEKIVRANNSAQGIQTKITKQTGQSGKAIGMMLIVFAIVILIVGFNQ